MKLKPCVHVIDDDPAIVKSLAALIEVLGFEVHTHTTSVEFLAAYEATAPACLILDVRLPGMSGPELQRRLVETGSDLPIVFITGHADKAVEAEAMARGAVGLLEKPFQAQELVGTVRKAIALAEANWQQPGQSVPTGKV